jgi:glycosyltransferase involved in cell wall biosynthesis
MVTFNAAAVIERALASVLHQRSAALELIVIDGQSTDGTVEILRRHDSAIAHWRSEPDNGIYDAMNKALSVATGDWLLFLGADDELLVNPARILERFGCRDAVYYGDVQIRRTGAISGGRFSRYRLMQENICHQAIFYPRSVYRRKRYDTTCGMLADHRYNIELCGAGTPFIHIDQTISRFEDKGRSSVRNPGFETVKLAAIRNSFGRQYYWLKRTRTAVVRLLKPRHGRA